MSKSNTELLKTKFLQLMVITMEECGELIQEYRRKSYENDEHKALKDKLVIFYCMIRIISKIMAS